MSHRVARPIWLLHSLPLLFIAFFPLYCLYSDIGYQGTATVELNGGDATYLKEVNARFDKILLG